MLTNVSNATEKAIARDASEATSQPVVAYAGKISKLTRGVSSAPIMEWIPARRP
jgi:hypothetical protein